MEALAPFCHGCQRYMRGPRRWEDWMGLDGNWTKGNQIQGYGLEPWAETTCCPLTLAVRAQDVSSSWAVSF